MLCVVLHTSVLAQPQECFGDRYWRTEVLSRR